MRHSNFQSPILSLYSLFVTSLALTPPSNNNNPSLSLHNLTLESPPPFTVDLHIQCLHLTEPPDLPPLQPLNCFDRAIVNACSKLVPPPPYPPGMPLPPPQRDQWVWSDPLPRTQSCALGWYLPATATAPRHLKCKYTLQTIVYQCAMEQEFNAGGINVETVPNLTGDGTAVEVDKVRYMMAPVQLTRGVDKVGNRG